MIRYLDKFFTYFEIEKNYSNIDVGTMHDSMGIHAFSTGQTKYTVKYWHRKEVK